MLHIVLVMDSPTINFSTIQLSNTSRLNIYYESVFGTLDTEVLRIISEVLAPYGQKQMRSQHLSGKVLLMNMFDVC